MGGTATRPFPRRRSPGGLPCLSATEREPAMQRKRTAVETVRAALYLRVSSRMQEEDGTSLQSQEERCRVFAAERGFSIAPEHVFTEIHTGVELWERPKLTALRQAARAGDIDTVVAYSIDRLSRDPVHLGVLISEADHAGVAVHFVTEPLDNSPEGQLIRFVRGYAAKVEHEKIKERTMRGRRTRAESGRLLPGNRPPYGYSWADEGKTHLIENPVTAPVVRRLFNEVNAGTTARQLALTLTAEGIPTPTGRERWCVPTIVQLIRHPVYYGEPRAFRYRWVTEPDGRRVRREAPESEQIAFCGASPALVTKELAQAASARLARNKSESTRNNRDPEAALLRAGYAVCGYCGHPLSAVNARGHGTLYRCNSANQTRYGCPYFGIQSAILDAAVWSKIEAVLTRPDIIATEVERLRKDDPTRADIETIERMLAGLTRKERNLMNRLADADDADLGDLITADLKGIAAQKRQLQDERRAVELQRANWEASQERLDDLTAWCQTVADNLGELSYAERRLAVNTLGVEVQVWRADHNPRWTIKMAVPFHTRSSC